MRPFIGITTPFITARVPYIYRLLWVHQRYDTDWYGINIAHANSRLEGLNTVFIQYCMCLSDANCKFEKKKVPTGLKHSSFVVAVDLFIEDPTWKVIVATTHLRCDVAKRTGFFATNWGWNPCRFVEGQVLCIGLVFLWVSPKQRALSPVSASFSSQCQKTVNRNAIDVFFKEQKWVLTTSWRAPPMFTSRQAVNF